MFYFKYLNTHIYFSQNTSNWNNRYPILQIGELRNGSLACSHMWTVLWLRPESWVETVMKQVLCAALQQTEQMQEIKFKLNQVFRRNRNSDPKPETKSDHIDMYLPEAPRNGRGGTFPLGYDRRD